jgi:hypothetical protein
VIDQAVRGAGHVRPDEDLDGLDLLGRDLRQRPVEDRHVGRRRASDPMTLRSTDDSPRGSSIHATPGRRVSHFLVGSAVRDDVGRARMTSQVIDAAGIRVQAGGVKPTSPP